MQRAGADRLLLSPLTLAIHPSPHLSHLAPLTPKFIVTLHRTAVAFTVRRTVARARWVAVDFVSVVIKKTKKGRSNSQQCVWFSCRLMSVARSFKPGVRVEADARKVLGSLEGHRLFPDDPTFRLRGTLVQRVEGKRAWNVKWVIPETSGGDRRVLHSRRGDLC